MGHQPPPAQSFAFDEVSRWLKSENHILALGPVSAAIWWKFGCDLVDQEDGVYITYYMDCEELFCTFAMHLGEARELFLRVISMKLMAGKPLGTHERIFAAAALSGDLPSISTKPGRKRKENHERNLFIARLVHEIVSRFELPPTRNDASVSFSACDLIADAFAANNKHEVTFEAVKKIWADKKFRDYHHRLDAVISDELSNRSGKPVRGLMDMVSNPLARSKF